MSVLDVQWQMATGERIAVCLMAESHVQNALNMLERKLGELVADDIFGETRSDHNEVMQFTHQWIRIFRAELERRNLTTWDRKRMQELAPVKLPGTFSS